jgi:hypothetical protein
MLQASPTLFWSSSAWIIRVIMAVANRRAPAGFAPLASGRVDGHPSDGCPYRQCLRQPGAKSAAAVFGGRTALSQLWLFWLAPSLGGCSTADWCAGCEGALARRLQGA